MVSKNKFQKLTTAQRREKIKELAESIGIVNINKKALAEQFGVTLKTIYNDYNYIIKHLRFKKQNELKFMLGNALYSSLGFNQRILVSQNASIKLKIQASKNIAFISDKITSFAENFGLKDKIPDQLEIKAQDNFFERLAKAWKEVKEDETRKRNSKRKRSKKSSKSSV